MLAAEFSGIDIPGAVKARGKSLTRLRRQRRGIRILCEKLARVEIKEGGATRLGPNSVVEKRTAWDSVGINFWGAGEMIEERWAFCIIS